MEPEQPTYATDHSPEIESAPTPTNELTQPGPVTGALADMHAVHLADGVFIGPQGLRAGWSTFLFLMTLVILVLLFGAATNFLLNHVIHVKSGQGFAPFAMIVSEGAVVLALISAASIMA